MLIVKSFLKDPETPKGDLQINSQIKLLLTPQSVSLQTNTLVKSSTSARCRAARHFWLGKLLHA